MIANKTPRIVEIKLENINALEAGLASAIAPMKAISQIVISITGKNNPPVAVLFTN